MKSILRRAAGLASEHGIGAMPGIAYRRLIFRSITMYRYGTWAGACPIPESDDDLRLEFLGPGAYDRVAGTSPYLSDGDLDRFREQGSTCIIMVDGDRVASSTWMTTKGVYFHELQRRLPIDQREHFSSRSFVDPDYRGRSLYGRMIAGYAARQDSQDIVWGLVLPENEGSIRGLLKIGWRFSGIYSSYFVFGRPYGVDRAVPMEFTGPRV